jgi:hypothetical protein
MNIRQLKIFGERNTGTRAVNLLIEQNIGKIICPSMRDLVKDWPAREALTHEFEDSKIHIDAFYIMRLSTTFFLKCLQSTNRNTLLPSIRKIL